LLKSLPRFARRTIMPGRLWLLPLLTAAGVGLHAQGTAPGKTEPAAQSSSPHIERFGSVLKKSVWESPEIYVCWEDIDPSDEGALWVREAIEGSWQSASALRFKGWARCAERSRGIRIHTEDVPPHTKGLGRQLDGRPGGIVLNFTFQSWSESCRNYRERCIKAIAVHEFGHAIGLVHEQNRADAPGECASRRQGPAGDLLLTPYDPNSVMNYCTKPYANGGQLSDLDRVAVAHLYGAPRSHVAYERL
jgi:hypothetical protein